MLYYSCRSIDFPARFVKDGVNRCYEIGCESKLENSPGQIDDAIILVHGFNSRPTEVEAAYDSIERVAKTFDNPIDRRWELVGFQWPSNGIATLVNYMSDLHDARKASEYLNRVRQSLIMRMGGKSPLRVHVIAHSQGCEVTMNALTQLQAASYDSIVLMGGDVLCRDMRVKSVMSRDYGRADSHVRGLWSYYSEHDEIVDTVARLNPFRAGKRIGANPLPDDTPGTWVSIDAETIHTDGHVGHGTYKQSKPLIHDALSYVLSRRVRRPTLDPHPNAPRPVRRNSPGW